jgi:hypothetical protein
VADGSSTMHLHAACFHFPDVSNIACFINRILYVACIASFTKSFGVIHYLLDYICNCSNGMYILASNMLTFVTESDVLLPGNVRSLGRYPQT